MSGLPSFSNICSMASPWVLLSWSTHQGKSWALNSATLPHPAKASRALQISAFMMLKLREGGEAAATGTFRRGRMAVEPSSHPVSSPNVCPFYHYLVKKLGLWCHYSKAPQLRAWHWPTMVQQIPWFWAGQVLRMLDQGSITCIREPRKTCVGDHLSSDKCNLEVYFFAFSLFKSFTFKPHITQCCRAEIVNAMGEFVLSVLKLWHSKSRTDKLLCHNSLLQRLHSCLKKKKKHVFSYFKAL